MIKVYHTGSKGALLDEYLRALNELIGIIKDISDEDLTRIVDNATSDQDCVSIQTILAHVVHSGYGYAHYIMVHIGHMDERPDKIKRSASQEYVKDLNNMYAYTEQVFSLIDNSELEEFNTKNKIYVPWGQTYDIEQLMEHAIVHILKHRRQIERFKQILSQH